MNDYSTKRARILAVMCASLAGGVAFAAPAAADTSVQLPALQPVLDAASGACKMSQTSGAAAPCLPGQAVSRQKLAAERGKADLGRSEANLGGVVSGNSATNVTTGSNIIDAGSFANMSGLPVVIQNTGANVLIQNATVINVMFK
ncbi:MAG: hypothetical protein H7267_07385 [Sandarakinorhabdus sp.]|nr:hypothetical protein [Sandarakinorhabdus sp.]